MHVHSKGGVDKMRTGRARWEGGVKKAKKLRAYLLYGPLTRIVNQGRRSSFTGRGPLIVGAIFLNLNIPHREAKK